MSQFLRHKHFLCFGIFCEKFKNSKWTPFLTGQNFLRVILWVNNFIKIALSSIVFEIQAFLCFAFLKKNLKIQNLLYLARFWRYKYFCVLQFCKKFEKSKWPPFLLGHFFENWVTYSPVPLWVKNFVEISLSSMVFKRQAFLKKNSKIQNGRHFWRVKYLLKLGKASLNRYPVGQKFCQNPTSKFLFYEENGFKMYSYITLLFYMCTL